MNIEQEVYLVKGSSGYLSNFNGIDTNGNPGLPIWATNLHIIHIPEDIPDNYMVFTNVNDALNVVRFINSLGFYVTLHPIIKFKEELPSLNGEKNES